MRRWASQGQAAQPCTLLLVVQSAVSVLVPNCGETLHPPSKQRLGDDAVSVIVEAVLQSPGEQTCGAASCTGPSAESHTSLQWPSEKTYGAGRRSQGKRVRLAHGAPASPNGHRFGRHWGAAKAHGRHIPLLPARQLPTETTRFFTMSAAGIAAANGPPDMTGAGGSMA